MLRKPPLTIPMILSDADAWRDRRGHWPGKNDNLEWRRIDNALRIGLRGLPGGSSLARLLFERRGVRNIQDLRPLTVKKILAWADEHFRQTGDWPTENSGAVFGQAGEKWYNITAALIQGLRGLPGESSLAKILEAHRGVRNRMALPPLSVKKILVWADRHYRRTGAWPSVRSGPVHDDPNETWLAIESALEQGGRGLPGGSTLARFIKQHRPRATVRPRRRKE